jgi:hypothetical protein
LIGKPFGLLDGGSLLLKARENDAEEFPPRLIQRKLLPHPIRLPPLHSVSMTREYFGWLFFLSNGIFSGAAD